MNEDLELALAYWRTMTPQPKALVYIAAIEAKLKGESTDAIVTGHELTNAVSRGASIARAKGMRVEGVEVSQHVDVKPVEPPTRIADAMDYHVTVTLQPWARRWEHGIAFSMLEPGQFVNLDETQYYRGDHKTIGEYGAKALGNNTAWETQNDIRVKTLTNNAADAVNDIDIDAGEAASTESDPVLMVLAAPLTKRLEAGRAAATRGASRTAPITSG